MQPVEIIRSARKLGIQLSAEGGFIVARPKGATPPALAEAIRQRKPELVALLVGRPPKPCDVRDRDEDEIDRPPAPTTKPLPEPGNPAYSIVEECRDYGVALRMDEAGDLVVGKAGAKADEPSQPWQALLAEIETHLEAVVRLIEAGWTLKAAFPPSQEAAA